MASFSKNLKPGDLIEIVHKDSLHWAVYVGDGDVVHLAPPVDSWFNAPSFRYNNKVVKLEALKDVIGRYSYKVNNHLDGQCPPLSENKILRRAKGKVGSLMGSSVGDKEFVSHLRHGVSYLTYSKQFYVEPNPGDLIEIFCSGYQHWVIYVGGGDVVHLTALRKFGDSSAKSGIQGEVKRELLSVVLGDCPFLVNNKLDAVHEALPVNQILSEAKKVVGTKIWYHDSDRNCEHFVRSLRYGKACSRQFYEVPNPGDLIEIFHKDGSHWAIYMGDGDVVHLFPPRDSPELCCSSASSLGSRMKVVKREPLKVVVGSSRWQINNYLDRQFPPLSEGKILERAKEKIGKVVKMRVGNKYFVTHLRHGEAYRKKLCEKLRPGDLIEIFRSDVYQHWAVYVGDGDVIHLTATPVLPELLPAKMSTFLTFKGEVREEPLEDVLDDCRYQVSNNRHKLTALPVEKVISRAKRRVGKSRYRLFLYNCEHFATDMRYDRPCCQQVKQWVKQKLNGLSKLCPST